MGWLSKFKKGVKGNWSSEEFWDWFLGPEGQMTIESAATSPGAQQLLAASLERVHPDLTWGMKPRRDDGTPGTLEVSGGGLREMIPIVRELVEAAPPIDGWKIVAFKQPIPDFTVQFGPKKEVFDSKNILVVSKALPDGRYDLDVYVPTPAGCPANTTGELGFIFLDHVLGEFTVMERLAELHFYSTLVAPPTTMTLATFAAGLEFRMP
jgi:hypothetical protein